MSMKGKKGQPDREVIPAGNYGGFKLAKIVCYLSGPTEYSPNGAPKLRFIYSKPKRNPKPNEPEEFEIAHFVGLPKEFQYNKRGAIWGHLGELAGATINDENAELVEFDAGDFITSYEELIQTINSTDERGKTESVEMGVSFNGQELVGTTVTLTVGMWENNGKKGNNIKAVVPTARPQAKPTPEFDKVAAQAQAPSQAAPAVAPAPTLDDFVETEDGPNDIDEGDLPF